MPDTTTDSALADLETLAAPAGTAIDDAYHATIVNRANSKDLDWFNEQTKALGIEGIDTGTGKPKDAQGAAPQGQAMDGAPQGETPAGGDGKPVDWTSPDGSGYFPVLDYAGRAAADVAKVPGDMANIAVGGPLRALQAMADLVKIPGDYLDAKIGGIQIFDPEGNLNPQLMGPEAFAEFKKAIDPENKGIQIPNIGGVMDRPDDSVTASFLQSAVQFLTGWGVVGKAAPMLKAGEQMGGTLANFAKETGKLWARAELTDFAAFDGQEGNMANLLQLVPALKGPVTDYLATDEATPELEGRLKNAIANAPLNLPFDLFVRQLRAVKEARKVKALTGTETYADAAKKLAEGGIPKAEAQAPVVGSKIEQLLGRENEDIVKFVDPYVDQTRNVDMIARALRGELPEAGSQSRFSLDGQASEQDNLGFYSKALESARALKQDKGTPEQMRAQLRTAGVKESELQAVGLDKVLEGKKSVTKDEIIQHLESNRVRVQERVYSDAAQGQIRDEKAQELFGRNYSELSTAEQYSVRMEAVASSPLQSSKWSQYSLDPSNPTYRETVLHLPVGKEQPQFDATKVEIKRKRSSVTQGTYEIHYDGKKLAGPYMDEAGPETNYMIPDAKIMETAKKIFENGVTEPTGRVQVAPQQEAFRSGHWQEPNVIAHARTQILTDAKGRKVFNVDELQSDWGQKLRDGGARDEAKIAELKKQMEAVRAEIDAIPADEKYVPHKYGPLEQQPFYVDAPNGSTDVKLSPKAKELMDRRELLRAEISTAEAATPGHPLVNTTDQWTTTALRRLIRQAVESGADAISFTPGKVQNQRFSLSKVVDEISMGETVKHEGAASGQARHIELTNRSGVVASGFVDLDGKIIKGYDAFRDGAGKNISEYVGKELASKLLANKEIHTLRKADIQELEIGGGGMKATYDQMYPRTLGKMLAKIDPSVKMETVNLKTADGRTISDAGLVEKIKDALTQSHLALHGQQARQLSERIASIVEKEGLAALDEYDPPRGFDGSWTVGVNAAKKIGDNATSFISFPLTDKIKQSVAKEGFPLFSLEDLKLTGKAQAEKDAIRAELADLGKRLPDGVTLKIEPRRATAGEYDPVDRIMYVSLAAENPARVFRHEEVHALRDINLIPESDWALLTKHAEKKGLRKAFGIDEKYGKLYEQQFKDAAERESILQEEVIAEMVARYNSGEKFGGKVDAILKRVKDFLRAVRDRLGIHGFRTVDDVFEGFEAGAFAKPKTPESRIGVHDYLTSVFKSLVYGNEPTTISPRLTEAYARTYDSLGRSKGEMGGFLSDSEGVSPKTAKMLQQRIGNVANEAGTAPMTRDEQGYLGAQIQKVKPELTAIDGGQSIAAKTEPFFQYGFKQDNGASITATQAYEHYVSWAEANKLPVLELPKFSEAMAKAGYIKQRMAGRVRYVGIDVEDNMPTNLIKGAILKPKDVTLPGGAKVPGIHLRLVPPSSDKPSRFAIDAFHGSPHDFEKFDKSKIGTGEGAQAFGHGLYFAESERVARSYKASLAKRTIDGKPLDYSNPKHLAADYLDSYGDKALDEMRKDIKKPGVKEALKVAEAGDVPKIDGGHVYKVRINANPEDFLDWDKPISAQPKSVQRLMRSIGTDESEPLDSMAAGDWLSTYIKSAMADPSSETLESMLQRRGIRGIRYLDQMSRGKGGGTANYVVFDDGLVEITHKDGRPVAPKVRYSLDAQERLSDDEINSVLDMWRYVREMKAARKPETLSQWLRRNGGIKDESGELGQINVDESLKPFVRRLARSDGKMTLDDAARSAWEAGYFDGTDRPTIRDFLDKLDEDTRSGDVVRRQDYEMWDNIKVAGDMENDLAELGVINAKSENEIRSLLGGTATNPTAEGRGGPRGGAANQGAAQGGGAGVTPPPLPPGASGGSGQRGQVYINWARINSPEDVKQAIQMTADHFAPEIDQARRGIRTNAMTEAAAGNENAWKLLIGERKGNLPRAEEQLALRQLWASSGQKVMELSKLAAQGGQEEMFAFRRMMAVHNMIQQQVIGIRTETARALQQWSIPAGGDGEKLRQLKFAIEANGGEGVTRALAERIAILAGRPGFEAAVDQMIQKGAYAKSIDTVREIWINSILSGPKTHIVNMMSNSAVVGQSILERAIAGRLGDILDPVEGVRIGEATAMMYGVKQAQKDALTYAAKTLRTGESGYGRGQIEGPRERAISAEGWGVDSDTALGKGLDMVGSVVNLPGRMLTAEDEFFKTINYRAELWAQAYRQAMGEIDRGVIKADGIKTRMVELITDPPENLRLKAADMAAYNTFQSEPGDISKTVMRFRSAVDDAFGLPIGTMVMPFINTPGNIMKYTFERTPLAPLMSHVQADIRAGGSRRDLALARIGLGTILVTSAYDLAMDGHVTGSGPDGDKGSGERQLLKRSGWQPYSIRIRTGGTDEKPEYRYVAYNRMDPIGSLFGMSAELAETMRNDDGKQNVDYGEVIAGLILGASQTYMNKSYFSGVAGIIEAMQNPDRYGEAYMTRILSSFVPTAVAEAARWQDPIVRHNYDTISAIKARIPGLSATLPPRLNFWGEPMTYQSGMGSLYDLVSPIYTSSNAKAKDIDKEFMSVDFFPTHKATITIDGKAISLRNDPEITDRIIGLTSTTKASDLVDANFDDMANGKKKAQLNRLMEFGEATLPEVLKAVISGSSEVNGQSYTEADTDEKKKILSDVIRAFRSAAQTQAIREFPDLKKRRADIDAQTDPLSPDAPF